MRLHRGELLDFVHYVVAAAHDPRDLLQSLHIVLRKSLTLPKQVNHLLLQWLVIVIIVRYVHLLVDHLYDAPWIVVVPLFVEIHKVIFSIDGTRDNLLSLRLWRSQRIIDLLLESIVRLGALREYNMASHRYKTSNTIL